MLMVAADNFSEDIEAATGNDHVNHFIQPGNFFSNIQQLAALNADADHGHGSKAHAHRISDRHNFQKPLIDEASVALTYHARRNPQLFGNLRKGYTPIFMKRINNCQVSLTMAWIKPTWRSEEHTSELQS